MRSLFSGSWRTSQKYPGANSFIKSLSILAGHYYPPTMAFLARWVSFFLAVVACLQDSTATVFPDLYEASVLELQAGLDAGTFSSVDLVKVSNLPFSLIR
jgi:hypothetical protein